MTQQPKSKPEAGAIRITMENNMQAIYADRVLNVAFGPAVSRLILGMETGTGTFTATTTLVLPTSSLLDAMRGVLNEIQKNEKLRDGMLKGLDTLKEQLVSQT